jgi:hypothetical protein
MAIGHKGVCLGVLLGLGLAGAAPAAEFNLSVKAEGIRLGASILGPKVAAADLKGRVVLLEFWGIH